MKKIIVILLLLPTFSLFAETVTLKSGKTIEGKIIERTDKYIKVDFQGVPLVYYFEDIKSIDDKLIFTPKQYTTPQTPSQKQAKDIFREISPAVVYITSKASTGDEAIGSGFIIDKNGVIVTNHHVVDQTQEISVHLKDGRAFPVDSVIYDSAWRDVFIFKINASELPTIQLGTVENLEIGDNVYTIGNPLGLEYSFSAGVLAAIRYDGFYKQLQFTAPISPGNSGGPLLNDKGQVIGINTLYFTGGQNLNFAVSAEEILPFINEPPKMTFAEYVRSMKEFNAYYAGGYKLLSEYNDFKGAATHFLQALKANPDSQDAYISLIAVYLFSKEPEKAAEPSRKFIERYPNHWLAYYLLGKSLHDKNDPKDKQEIISAYKKAIELNPASALAYKGLALEYMGKDIAISYLEKAHQFDPYDVDTLTLLGMDYAAKGKKEEAEALWEKAKKIDPEAFQGWMDSLNQAINKR